MTPLQGALIAATVANGGRQMRPYLVQQLLSAGPPADLQRRPRRRCARRSTRQVAGDLQDMMVSVVENGTGQQAEISGFEVGGKTGTAQNAEGADPHGWFIGFAFNEQGRAGLRGLRHAGERARRRRQRRGGPDRRAHHEGRGRPGRGLR